MTITKGVLLAGIVCARQLCVLAGDRTVSIVSSDSETGTINLAFGGAAEGRALFVAQDDADKGTVPSAWRETRLVTYVKGSDTSYAFVVPGEMRRKAGTLRFFLSHGADYDVSAEYIHPTASDSVRNYDTEIVPTAGTGVTIDFELTSALTAETSFFGVWDGCGIFFQKDQALVKIPGMDTTVTQFLSGPALGGGKLSLTRHSLVIQKGASLDGNPVSFIQSDWHTSYKGGYDHEMPEVLNTMRLFVTTRNQATFDGIKPCTEDLRIYGFDVRDGEKPAASLRPCIKNGVACFWDSVREKLIEPSTDSGFAWGGKLTGTPFDAGAEASGTFALTRDFGGRRITAAAVEGEYKVNLTFSGAGKRFLYVAHDTEDRGTDPADWKDVSPVCTIAADQSAYVYEIPEEWRNRAAHALRFFLSSPDADTPYDELYQWIAKEEGDTHANHAYFDTGLVPTRDATVTMDLRIDPTDGYERALFGLHLYFGVFMQDTGAFVSLPGIDTNQCTYLRDVSSGTKSWSSGRQVLRLGRDEFSINGARRPLNNGATSGPYTGGFDNELLGLTTRTLPLFAVYRNTDGGEVKYVCRNTWVYGCDVEMNGRLAGRYIAAKKGGKACLYDEVKNVCLPSVNGDFYVGGGTRGPTLTTEKCETTAVIFQERSVRVSQFDQTKNSVSLEFSGLPVAGSVYAVYDKRGDCGANPRDYEAMACLGAVAAGTTHLDLTGAIPRKWLSRGGAIRFFCGSVAYEQRLEWIGNTEEAGYGQYVLTGYRPTKNGEFAIKARHSIRDIAAFGIVAPNVDYSVFYAFPHSNGPVYTGFFGAQVSVEGVAKQFVDANKEKDIDATSPYELKFSSAGLWFPDLRTMAYDGGYVPTDRYPIYMDGTVKEDVVLFGSRADGVRAKYQTPIRIYWATAKESGVPVMDLVPCVKDGVVGFYDRVRSKFLGNTGTGTFAAGPAMEFTLDDISAGAVSDACTYNPFGVILVVR